LSKAIICFKKIIPKNGTINPIFLTRFFMKKLLYPLIFPFISISVVFFIAFAEFRSKNEPTFRNKIKTPVYTISKKDFSDEMEKGRRVVRLGPMFWGLYPGGIAFSNLKEAKAIYKKNKMSSKLWRIYLLSGDYSKDVTQHYTNKTLWVLKEEHK
jgi:hypothetical protein